MSTTKSNKNIDLDNKSKDSNEKHISIKSSNFNNSQLSSLKLDAYDSSDDLENLVGISYSDSHIKKKLRNNDDESVSVDYRKYLKLKKFDHSAFNSFRFLNCLSILILLATFYSTTLSQLNNKKEYNLIIEFLRRDKIQAESNLLILSIAFCFVSCKIILNEI
jgi:hypothetical protein